MRTHLSVSIVVLACVGALAPLARVSAQTNEELERRIAALEAEKTARSSTGLLSKLGSMFDMYGFMRVDALYNDSEFNDTEIAFRVLSEDGVTTRKNDSDFTMHTRLTRLGFNFVGPDVATAKLTGKLEVDFYGFDSTDSRNEIRIRHGYLILKRNDCEFLAGQTAELISPLYTSFNPDFLGWHVGNLGDKRPQVRFTYAPSVGENTVVSLAGALMQQGAIAARNTDAPDGVLDGEDSGRPQMQGRAALRTTLFEGDAAEFGVWGARGWEEVDGDNRGDFDLIAYGIDLRLPVLPSRAWILCEAWQGQNLADVRGGVGQGVNATTLQEIEACGGFVELNVKVDDIGTVFGGYTVDDPDRNDVPVTTGIVHNSAIYAGVTVTRWGPVVTGFDWSYWETRYRGAAEGDANRFRWYIAYKF